MRENAKRWFNSANSGTRHLGAEEAKFLVYAE